MSPESGNRFRDKDMRKNKWVEHFQQKCEAVLRKIMRTNKEIERFLNFGSTGTARGSGNWITKEGVKIHAAQCDAGSSFPGFY